MDLEEKKKISGVTTTILYLYQVPAKLQGQWSATLPAAISREPMALDLKQQITRFSGDARVGSRNLPIEEGKILGEQVNFRVAIGGKPYAFAGTVKGKAIQGTVEGGGTKASWNATLK